MKVPSLIAIRSLLDSFRSQQSRRPPPQVRPLPFGGFCFFLRETLFGLNAGFHCTFLHSLQSMVELNSYLTQQGKGDGARTAPAGSMESTIQEVHDDDILVSLSARFLSSTAVLLSLTVQSTNLLTSGIARLEIVASSVRIRF